MREAGGRKEKGGNGKMYGWISYVKFYILIKVILKQCLWVPYLLPYVTYNQDHALNCRMKEEKLFKDSKHFLVTAFLLTLCFWISQKNFF